MENQNTENPTNTEAPKMDEVVNETSQTSQETSLSKKDKAVLIGATAAVATAYVAYKHPQALAACAVKLGLKKPPAPPLSRLGRIKARLGLMSVAR